MSGSSGIYPVIGTLKKKKKKVITNTSLTVTIKSVSFQFTHQNRNKYYFHSHSHILSTKLFAKSNKKLTTKIKPNKLTENIHYFIVVIDDWDRDQSYTAPNCKTGHR